LPGINIVYVFSFAISAFKRSTSSRSFRSREWMEKR
jgi:hypothetical protein